MFMSLCIIYGFFGYGRVEYHDRAENIYCLVLHRKHLMTPDLT